MGRICQVEVGRYDYAFTGEFKFFKPGPDGVVRRPSVLVRLSDEYGLQGWGQAVPVPTWTYETVETVESTLRHYLADALLGLDPVDLPAVHREMNAIIRPAFSTGQPLCKAAVDLACYDLAGKQAGVPVSQLLGGAQRQELLLNWTINTPTIEELEKQLQIARRRGYAHFTIKIGPPQTPEYDLELVRRVRDFAPDGFLWVDANTGYAISQALEISPRLADLGVQALESPLPPNQIHGYQALVRQGAVPVYMDEGILSPVETLEFIELGMLNGITMKHSRCGGLWPTAEIIRLAQERGLGLLASGLTDPDISLAAALHVFAWANIDTPCALNGPQFLAESLLEPGLVQDGDWIQVPAGPGLGIELSSSAVECLKMAASI